MNNLDPRDLWTIARAISRRSTTDVRRGFVRLAPPLVLAMSRQDLPTVRIPRID